ncbi:hypothetical protein BJV82DRAFT_674386 [Fennellomyces sp. T-0311]|nr:hypothetical protein BJV82DRAFT_674386 [Fennellomyces sp. T-0311]
MTNIRELDTLPIEIQHAIFSFLKIKDRWQFGGVCASWRAMILNWQGMWDSVSTSRWLYSSSNRDYYRPFILGHSVKRVFINHGGPAEAAALVDFLASLKCDAIEVVRFVVPYLTSSSLTKLVKMSGSTLSDVAIILNEFDEEDAVELGERPPNSEGPDVLLRHCPNLSKLMYVGLVNSIWIHNLVDIRHEHLTELALNICNSPQGLDTEVLLKATPKLQHLAMTLANVSNDQRFSRKLHQYCPELSSLLLTCNMMEGIAIRNLHSWPRHGTKSSSEPGLEYLTIFDISTGPPIATAVFSGLIDGMRSTLRYLELSGNDILNVDLAGTVLPSLTHFVISYNYCYVSDNLASFLRHSVPNLSHLKVKTVYPGDTLLSILIDSAQCLKEIELGYCDTMTTNTLAHFIEVLGHPNRCLRRIRFRPATPALTPDVLQVIATSQLLAIDHLDIDIATGRGEKLRADDLEKFLDDIHSAGKKMNNLAFAISPCENPKDFLESSEGKVFVQKLDLAAREWQLRIWPQAMFTFSGKQYRCTLITHNQYRKRRI